MNRFFELLGDPLSLHLFNVAGADITVGSLIGALTSIVVLLVISRWLRVWLLKRLLARGHLDISTRETISSLLNYVVLAIGTVMIIDGIGIKLSSFTVLAGALGVGVGFGLQNIFSNFISGLIVMFERPVKIGDHIVVSGAEGDVVEIGMRATTLRTAQGSIVIVPNQSFITGNVINWNDRGFGATVLQFRMMGKIDEDEKLVLDCITSHAEVATTPAPEVFVISLDHAAHTMEVHFRLSGDPESRQRIISNINRSILEALCVRGQALAP